MINISKVNESYLKINCELDEARFISDAFFFIPKEYYFMKKSRPNWNGKIKFFDVRTGYLPLGLLSSLINKLTINNFEFKLDKSCAKHNIEVSEEAIRAFIKYKLNIDVDDLVKQGKLNLDQLEYQIDATVEAIKLNKDLILLPTGSGKSFTQFLVANYCLANGFKKFLIVVPTINLVNQMESDFLDYAKNVPNYHDNLHKIYSGQEKNNNKSVAISTWQSARTFTKEQLESYDGILIDEVHGAENGKELDKIISSCINAKIKLGMTGTLSGDKIKQEQVEALFGPARYIKDRKTNQDIDTNFLIEKCILTDYNIKMVVLKYPEAEKKAFNKELKNIKSTLEEKFPDGVPKKDLQKAKYDYEMQYLRDNKLRTRTLIKYVKATKGNTLVLFKNVEYGEMLAELMDKYTGKKVYLIHGAIKPTERERIRQIIDIEEDIIICASTQIFSTGINIKSLSYLFFAQGSKGRIKILQSIGRLLRKFEGKTSSKFIDLVDDINGKNFSYKHAVSRLEIYEQEGSKYEIREINL